MTSRTTTARERKMWRRTGSAERGFEYLAPDGSRVEDEESLERIRTLAIPPAWSDARVSPTAGAKVQAVGYDAAGRKQYIYNESFVRRNARRKFRRLLPFARALPQLRAATNEHLRREGLGRERVLATVVRLMVRAYFRVGSERYAVNNRTFGITTLEKRHLTIEGNSLVFSYRGKSSIDQRRVVAETPLVEIIRELLDLPGDRLFRYVADDGAVRDVNAQEVNRYLREILDDRYTSKDIRTWGGTVRAATVLADLGPAQTKREAEKNIVLTCKLVSSELGNTPSVCRSAYIHPTVLEKYVRGKTIEGVMRKTPRPVEAKSPVDYYPEEAALMRLLEGNKPGDGGKGRKRKKAA